MPARPGVPRPPASERRGSRSPAVRPPGGRRLARPGALRARAPCVRLTARPRSSAVRAGGRARGPSFGSLQPVLEEVDVELVARAPAVRRPHVLLAECDEVQAL